MSNTWNGTHSSSNPQMFHACVSSPQECHWEVRFGEGQAQIHNNVSHQMAWSSPNFPFLYSFTAGKPLRGHIWRRGQGNQMSTTWKWAILPQIACSMTPAAPPGGHSRHLVSDSVKVKVIAVKLPKQFVSAFTTWTCVNFIRNEINFLFAHLTSRQNRTVRQILSGRHKHSVSINHSFLFLRVVFNWAT